VSASSGGPVDLLDMGGMGIAENTPKHAAPTGDVFSDSSTSQVRFMYQLELVEFHSIQ
jgi:hypothetical protein